MPTFDAVIKFIQESHGTDSFIPLHAPTFRGNEKKYLLDTIDHFE
jgi:perosamine synthetase